MTNRGRVHVIKIMQARVRDLGGQSAVLPFANHPPRFLWQRGHTLFRRRRNGFDKCAIQRIARLQGRVPTKDALPQLDAGGAGLPGMHPAAIEQGLLGRFIRCQHAAVHRKGSGYEGVAGEQRAYMKQRQHAAYYPILFSQKIYRAITKGGHDDMIPDRFMENRTLFMGIDKLIPACFVEGL